MAAHHCPECGAETNYRLLSGGREWYCPGCEADGEYGAQEGPRRVQMLRTEDGRKELREEMDRALALLSTGKDAGTVVREVGLNKE